MVFQLRRKSVKLWLWSCHKIIANRIQYYLDYPEHYGLDQQAIRHQTWRLAFNYYCGGEFSLAWPILYNLCTEERIYWISTEVISQYNLITARCSLEMYFVTRDRLYLHHAYNFYQVSIETMKFDIYAMFRLPMVLHEFGEVMEHYGAFDAAMKTYSKIVTNFPNYRGYFHVMFRTTIVGKYIAEYSDSTKAEEFIGQCIDTLQFLLEALPVGINDVHAVLHYARCLEASSNPANRFRAVGVYQSLQDLCKKKKPEIAETSKFVDFKEWIEEPRTWRLLGDYMLSHEEELLARDCHRVYVEKVNIRRKKSDMEALDIPMLMKMARNCASIQNYNDAANYALMALKINHYNKEVRQAISQYSPVHAKRIQLEEHSVFLIENLWRSRWMTPGYRKRYQQLIIHELEMKLKLNYWNMRTRRELAYYAKSKWRPHFVFENDCALKIQKQFKKAKIIWKWQAPQRAKYSLLASEIYRQYNKTPLKRSIREEVYRLVRHKYVSRKHAIHKLTPTMKHQDHAHRVIWKAWKAYKFRQDLDRSIKLRQERRHQEYLRSTIKIQTLWRIYLAKKLKIILTNHQQKKIHAAVVIQRYIRHRFRTFHYNVRRLLAQQQRQRYQLQYFLHFSLLSLWRKYLQRKLYKARVIAAANTIRRYYRIWNRQKQRIRYLHRMATRIQVMYRNYCIQHLAGVTKKLLKIRKIIDYSVVGTELLTSLHEEPPSAAAGKGRGGGAGAGGGGGGMDGSSCYYKSPGIKANTLPYQTLLNQHTVYCNQSFTATDAILLGAVLRNPLCRIRRLIFHSINGSNPSFEFDLLSSFTHCHSLRLIAILGGTWPISFIKKLIETIQLENPLIQTLLLESLHQVKSLEINQIVQSSSFLLLDFFNYSVPGIRYLSLHGLNLVDDDLKLLADGLRVNTSLTHFILSLNLIEDPGFLLLLNALIQNHHKSSLVYLDLSWNLICLNEGTVRLLDSYPSTGARALTTYPLPPTASKHKEFPLTINLLHNRITVPYHPIDEDRTDLVVQTVEEEGPSRDGQRRGQGGATMKSKKMFNLSNSPKNPNKENKSKFKSALQQKISSKSQFMSKTTT